jgi:hypothetical protein
MNSSKLVKLWNDLVIFPSKNVRKGNLYLFTPIDVRLNEEDLLSLKNCNGDMKKIKEVLDTLKIIKLYK